LIQKLIDRKITSANSDLDIVLLHFDGHSLRAELINTFSLSHEHDLQLCSLRVVVDELSQLFVSGIFLDWNINSNSLLQINNVLLQSFNFNLSILQLLQELQRGLIRFIDLLFELQDVISGIFKLCLELVSGNLVVLFSSEGLLVLLVDIAKLLQRLLQRQDLAVASKVFCSKLLNSDFKGDDGTLIRSSVALNSIAQFNDLEVLLLPQLFHLPLEQSLSCFELIDP